MESKHFVFVCSYVNMGVKKHQTAREETQVCFRFHTQTKFDISSRKLLLINLANHEECGHSELLKEALKLHVAELTMSFWPKHAVCRGNKMLAILMSRMATVQ